MNHDSQETGDAIQTIVEDLCNRPDEQDIIYQRDWRYVMRRTWIDGTPSVVKLWARPDLKGIIRRRLGISSARYEWENLKLLHGLGIPVPRPIAFRNVARNTGGFTEALVMEELVGCQGMETYLKGLIEAKDEERLARLESEMVEITKSLVKARIVDYDHAVINMVVLPSGKPYRLDVEQARQVKSLTQRKGLYARMLGQFLGSYTFMTQPDLERPQRFAKKVLEGVQPPDDVLPLIQKHMDGMFARQAERRDIHVSLTLPAFERR